MNSIFGTKFIKQYCVICDDIESVKRNWAEFFGTAVPPTLPSEGYKYTKTVFMDQPAIGAAANNAPFEFGEGTDLELEVLRPVGRVPSEWENFFVEHGPGIHHVAFNVIGIDEKIERAAQMGFKCRQQGSFGRGIGRYAYLDTHKQLKITMELIEIFPEKFQPGAPVFDLPIVPPKKRPTHITLVVNDIEAVSASYSQVFGIEPVFVKECSKLSGVKTYYKGELLQEESYKVAVFDFETIKLEFIEPGEGQSIWRDFIEKNGEGTHHIAFKVDDFNESLNECKNRGWEVIQSSYREDGSGIYAYLDSTHDLGCMIEISIE